MFKNIFETIEGINIWPIIALIIFFVFFSIMLFYVLRKDKEHEKYMSNLPLEDKNEIIN